MAWRKAGLKLQTRPLQLVSSANNDERLRGAWLCLHVLQLVYAIGANFKRFGKVIPTAGKPREIRHQLLVRLLNRRLHRSRLLRHSSGPPTVGADFVAALVPRGKPSDRSVVVPT